MSNTQFKKAYDDVAPDMFMETRILANIKHKKKKHSVFKPVLSGVLALAAVAACISSVNYKNADKDSVTYVDRPFSVMVAVASDDFEITQEIGENAISLPLLKIDYDSEGSIERNLKTGESKLSPIVETDSECGLSVVGDDIDYVQYKCNNDYLVYFDSMRMFYDIENQNYYSVIIPVPDDRLEEVNNLINKYNVNPEENALKSYAENYDISAYFGDNDTDLDKYQITFMKCSDLGYPQNNDGCAFYLAENGWVDKYIQNSNLNELNEITVNYYELSENTLKNFTDDEIREMSAVEYYPSQASDALFENPDIDKSKLPGDEITVIVTFKNGEKAKKVISVSFDDEGYAQFAYK